MCKNETARETNGTFPKQFNHYGNTFYNNVSKRNNFVCI